MINNVTLVGRLTKAPEVNQTQSGMSYLTNNLAVNRNRKNENGDREADFINIVAWNKTAELIAQYCGKGSQIGVTGRIQTRNYDNQQGQRVYVTEVVVNQVALLDSKGNQQNQGYQDNQGYNQQSNYQNQGYQQSQQGSFFQGQTTNPANISDDDLPF